MAKENSSYPIPKAVRFTFDFLSRISPKLASKVAEPLFFRPLRFPIPKRELPFREEAINGIHRSDMGEIHWFHMPGNGQKILFVHGWSGRGSQFAPLMEMASEEGFDVYTFDAPGHGKEVLKRTDMLSFVHSIQWMNEKFGPFHLAVGHSLGGMALWNAINAGLPIYKLINIGSPSSIKGVLSDFVNAIGAKPIVVDRLLEKLGKNYQLEPRELSPVHIVQSHQEVKGLLLHDEDDGDVPIEHALKMAEEWTNASFIRTKGLGHRRILRDEKILKECLHFLQSPS